MKTSIFYKMALCILSVAHCFSAMAIDTGNLQIACKPGSRIYLDGELIDTTKSERDGSLLLEGISPGEHKVRGEEADFMPQEFGIWIEVGKTRKIRIGKDGVPMVLIPAGEFQMGSNDYSDEKPVHPVYVDAFYMDKYEVTNAQYKKFMDATRHKAPVYGVYWDDTKYNAPNQPVVGVTWNDAKAYAEWAGRRLPTEAEWEKAARGGLRGKKYPWGNEKPDAGGTYRTNYAPGNNDADGYEYTAPVGSFLPNGYGLYDMTGNVWEWCADWYDSSYYSSSLKRNPTGPSSGTSRVLRGGAWDYFGLTLRCAARFEYPPTLTANAIGFRCCASRSD